MIKIKLKIGDQVRVLSGDHKGSEGKIVKLFKVKNLAIVEGVNMVKKHNKPSSQNPKGGITEQEAPIHISNIAHLDPESGKASRVKYEFKDGVKRRISVVSGSSLDK